MIVMSIPDPVYISDVQAPATGEIGFVDHIGMHHLFDRRRKCVDALWICIDLAIIRVRIIVGAAQGVGVIAISNAIEGMAFKVKARLERHGGASQNTIGIEVAGVLGRLRFETKVKTFTEQSRPRGAGFARRKAAEVHRGEHAAVVGKVGVHSDADLVQISGASNLAGRLAGLLQCGQENRDEQRDDGDDDEQFDERKSVQAARDSRTAPATRRWRRAVG